MGEKKIDYNNPGQAKAEVDRLYKLFDNGRDEPAIAFAKYEFLKAYKGLQGNFDDLDYDTLKNHKISESDYALYAPILQFHALQFRYGETHESETAAMASLDARTKQFCKDLGGRITLNEMKNIFKSREAEPYQGLDPTFQSVLRAMKKADLGTEEKLAAAETEAEPNNPGAIPLPYGEVKVGESYGLPDKKFGPAAQGQELAELAEQAVYKHTISTTPQFQLC